MDNMNTAFEVFINTHTSRIAVVEAANIYDAFDRAFHLFPGVDFRRLIIVPTTMKRVLRGALNEAA